MAKKGVEIQLGADASGVKKELTVAEQALKGFEKSVDKTAQKLVKGSIAAGIAAVGTAIAKMCKDAVSETQVLGDRWAVSMAGMKAAYGTFIANLASGEGFRQLADNIAEAVRLAREAANELDELFERKSSYSIQEASLRSQIAILNQVARDTSRSDKEREDAAKKLIELERQLGALRKDIADQEVDANAKILKARTGLSDEQLSFMIDEYNANRDIIAQAREYNAEVDRLNGLLKASGRSFTSTSGALYFSQTGDAVKQAREELQALNESTAESVKQVAQLARQYDKSSDELVSAYVSARVAQEGVAGEEATRTTRANTLLGSFERKAVKTGNAEVVSEAKAIADAIKEAADAFREKAAAESEAMDYDNDMSNLASAMMDEYLKLNPVIDQVTQNIVTLANANIAATDATNAAAAQTESKWKATMDNVTNIVVSAGEDMAQAFGEAIGNALTGGSMQNFGTELLSIVGSVMVKFGELAVSAGVTSDAIKQALKLENPYVAIAAGMALIALGSAVSSAASNLASGGNYAASGTVSQAYTTSSSLGDYATKEIEVTVTGQLYGSGSQLVAVINNENKRKNLTT